MFDLILHFVVLAIVVYVVNGILGFVFGVDPSLIGTLVGFLLCRDFYTKQEISDLQTKVNDIQRNYA